MTPFWTGKKKFTNSIVAGLVQVVVVAADKMDLRSKILTQAQVVAAKGETGQLQNVNKPQAQVAAFGEMGQLQTVNEPQAQVVAASAGQMGQLRTANRPKHCKN